MTGVLEPLQQLFTIVGLPVVGIMIAAIYATLVRKSELLSESVKDLKTAYDSVVETLRTRADVVDKRFDEEEKFRGLYLKMLTDSEDHRKMIETWKNEEITLVRTRVTDLQDRIRSLEHENQTLREEGISLRTRMAEIERTFKMANIR